MLWGCQSKMVGPLTIAAGLRETTLTVSRGAVPELAIVCFQPEVRNSASYTQNCYDFQVGQTPVYHGQWKKLSCAWHVLRVHSLSDALWRAAVAHIRLQH